MSDAVTDLALVVDRYQKCMAEAGSPVVAWAVDGDVISVDRASDGEAFWINSHRAFQLAGFPTPNCQECYVAQKNANPWRLSAPCPHVEDDT